MTADDLSASLMLECIERELQKQGKGQFTRIEQWLDKVRRCEMSLREAMFEWGMSEILLFVQGKSLAGIGPGITTYLDATGGQARTHEICLELERRGQIVRHFEENNYIVWKPLGE